MPDRIKHLPPELSNQIAAGEVIERPASVLKELLDNSIDANGRHIVMKVEKSGVGLISVADDGIGMSRRDAICAFDRHATSKISTQEDLSRIHTLGFRGEALSSIAAVSRIKVKTREWGSQIGTFLEIEDGKIVTSSDIGCPEGTEIEVRDLFYNVPARKKFLKSHTTELGHIINIVTRYAMAYKELHLTLSTPGKRSGLYMDFPSVEDVRDRIYQIYGEEVLNELLDIYFENDEYRLQGLISKPTLTFRGRENQSFFVNRRFVKNPTISHAVQKAYSDLIPGDRYPFLVLFLELNPLLVDVNVHPTKREVRFKENAYVHDMVVETIREGLSQKRVVPSKDPSIHEPLERYNSYNSSITEPHQYENIIIEPVITDIHGDRDEYVQVSDKRLYIKILGQIGVLFVVAGIEDELAIIDQHAAHERIIYDRLKKMSTAEIKDIQTLLFPEVVDLPHDRAYIFKDYLDILHHIGFDVDQIGDRSFIIRSIPALFSGDDIRQLLTDMLEEIIESDLAPGRLTGTIAVDSTIKALLSRKACHKAVRARNLLSEGEMTTLLEDLMNTEMPYTCPHGRPVMKRFSMEDLEKMFNRK